MNGQRVLSIHGLNVIALQEHRNKEQKAILSGPYVILFLALNFIAHRSEHLKSPHGHHYAIYWLLCRSWVDIVNPSSRIPTPNSFCQPLVKPINLLKMVAIRVVCAPSEALPSWKSTHLRFFPPKTSNWSKICGALGTHGFSRARNNAAAMDNQVTCHVFRLHRCPACLAVARRSSSYGAPQPLEIEPWDLEARAMVSQISRANLLIPDDPRLIITEKHPTYVYVHHCISYYCMLKELKTIIDNLYLNSSL